MKREGGVILVQILKKKCILKIYWEKYLMNLQISKKKRYPFTGK